jgi:hypothetical protein
MLLSIAELGAKVFIRKIDRGVLGHEQVVATNNHVAIEFGSAQIGVPFPAQVDPVVLEFLL